MHLSLRNADVFEFSSEYGDLSATGRLLTVSNESHTLSQLAQPALRCFTRAINHLQVSTMEEVCNLQIYLMKCVI